jgi:Tfp pilus assembly protein PilN
VRPVNLIPTEERRDHRAPTRTGRLPYVLVGGLVAAVAAVALLTTTSNSVAEREAELASLEAEKAAAAAQATQLAPYAEFASVEEARTATVASLAQSRFDWERVLHELSRVVPEDVWLINLTGTVSPSVGLEGAADSSLRSEIAGPALSIIGCGSSHEAVAGFLAALEDIDGVTRVGVTRSELSSSQGPGGGGGGIDDCRTRDFISKFEAVAAFDEVAAPAVPSADPAAAAAAPVEASAPAETTTPTGTGDVQAEQQAGRDSIDDKSQEARNATNLIPGVAR